MEATLDRRFHGLSINGPGVGVCFLFSYAHLPLSSSNPYSRPGQYRKNVLFSQFDRSDLRLRDRTTVATTSFPDPRIGCEQQTNNEIFTEVVLHRCGDNMFSGHTAIYAVVVLIYATYFNSAFRQQLSPLFRALVVFIVWGLGIGASLLIILNRSHYTIDVLVAWYVSTGVWFVQLWWWTRYAVRYKSLQIIIFPDNRRIEGINTWKAI